MHPLCVALLEKDQGENSAAFVLGSQLDDLVHGEFVRKLNISRKFQSSPERYRKDQCQPYGMASQEVIQYEFFPLRKSAYFDFSQSTRRYRHQNLPTCENLTIFSDYLNRIQVVSHFYNRMTQFQKFIYRFIHPFLVQHLLNVVFQGCYECRKSWSCSVAIHVVLLKSKVEVYSTPTSIVVENFHNCEMFRIYRLQRLDLVRYKTRKKLILQLIVNKLVACHPIIDLIHLLELIQTLSSDCFLLLELQQLKVAVTQAPQSLDQPHQLLLVRNVVLFIIIELQLLFLVQGQNVFTLVVLWVQLYLVLLRQFLNLFMLFADPSGSHLHRRELDLIVPWIRADHSILVESLLDGESANAAANAVLRLEDDEVLVQLGQVIGSLKARNACPDYQEFRIVVLHYLQFMKVFSKTSKDLYYGIAL